jgi:hypothetical protein
MCGNASTRRNVSQGDIEELAKLFNRSEYADDPNSRDAKEAEAQYGHQVKMLYEERIAPNSISYFDFKGHLTRRCREFLKRNPSIDER